MMDEIKALGAGLFSLLLVCIVLLASGCGATTPARVEYSSTPRSEASSGDALLAETQAACNRYGAHVTRRVNRAVMVRPGFWVSCH